MNIDFKKAQKSKQLIKRIGDPYLAQSRPNRFRTLHKQSEYKPKKSIKNPSIQNSYGNIIINISDHVGTKSLKSRTGNYGSLDIDLDHDNHKLSLKHRRSLDNQKFKSLISDSRLIKARSNLKQKIQQSKQLLPNPSTNLNKFKQSLNKFLISFQQVVQTPINLQTHQLKNPLVSKCQKASATILSIVTRRRLRQYFKIILNI